MAQAIPLRFLMFGPPHTPLTSPSNPLDNIYLDR
jgi:hypothetical protein